MEWLSKLNHLKTSVKIIGLMIVMTIFLVGAGTVGYYATYKVTQAMDQIYAQHLQSVRILNSARATSRSMEGLMLEAMLPGVGPVREKAIMGELSIRVKELNDLMMSFSSLELDNSEQEKSCPNS